MILFFILIFQAFLTSAQQPQVSLHSAVRKQDYSLITDLLSQGFNVNNTNDTNQTPLHIAAHIGDVEAALMLMRHGALVDAPDIEGSSPLHYAARGNKLEVVQLLCDFGANITLQNNYKITPMYIAAHFGSLEAAHYLANKGADLTEADPYGATLIMCAAEENTPKNVYTVALLHNLGAPLNEVDLAGNTSLHATVHRGAVGSLIALIVLKANPLIKDKQGQTPADLAESYGYHEIAAALRVYESTYQSKDQNIVCAHVAENTVSEHTLAGQ